jgi:hypothetical protein
VKPTTGALAPINREVIGGKAVVSGLQGIAARKPPNFACDGTRWITFLRLLNRARHELAVAKLPATIEAIRERVEAEEKVVVFTNYQAVVEAISETFGAACVSITGAHSSEARQQAAAALQSPTCPARARSSMAAFPFGTRGVRTATGRIALGWRERVMAGTGHRHRLLNGRSGRGLPQGVSRCPAWRLPSHWNAAGAARDRRAQVLPWLTSAVGSCLSMESEPVCNRRQCQPDIPQTA